MVIGQDTEYRFSGATVEAEANVSHALRKGWNAIERLDTLQTLEFEHRLKARPAGSRYGSGNFVRRRPHSCRTG